MNYQTKLRKMGTMANVRMITDTLDRRARTAIDIGCDAALIATHLDHLGLKVDAFEPDPQGAKEAREFIRTNQSGVTFQDKLLSLEDIERMPSYDVVCFLSVYHQIVANVSLEHANRFIQALYRKAKGQLYFQACVIHAKHRRAMPFIEGNTNSVLEYITSVLRASGEPVHAHMLGYSQNGLPVSEPFRPMFLFEKRAKRETFALPSMMKTSFAGVQPASHLLHIDISNTVSEPALQTFSAAGWHHFTEACGTLLQGAGEQRAAAIERARAGLADYFDRFQPATVGEVWRRAGITTDIGLLALRPTRHYCNWLPWNAANDTVDAMRAGSTHCNVWPDHDCHAYGPVSAETQKMELQRLHDIVVKLANEGYEPEVNADGYVRGQLMVRGGESRFLVTAGQHRLAALSALGYREIVAKFQPGYAKVLNLAEVRTWPQVANGTYTVEQATNIFNGLFEANGRGLREALKSAPKVAPVRLPEIKPYRVAATFENGWSDQYGALHVAAAHAGLAMPAAYAMQGIWQHGCDGPWLDFSPALLCNNAPQAKTLPVLVARREQAELLQAHGYAQARAVGLPIVYTRPSGLARMPRSLLVMPTHTLVGDQFPERAEFEKYADEINAIAGGFDRVTICIHPSCRKNGLWISEFTARGFEIVYGAQNNDLNSLARVRALFEQYETVTTNGWGSHVAYALAFGARVAIYGTQPKRSEADYLRDATWAADKDALRQALSDDTAARERAYLAPFLVVPAQAVADVARGSWLIGAELKVSPTEMAALLATVMTPVPGVVVKEPAVAAATGAAEAAFLEAARQTRTQARIAARELLQAGRRGEAIQTLVRAVKADVAAKHPLNIVEALVEIGDDLSGLEPKQAAFLGEQATRLAQANGFDLAAMRARLLPGVEAEAAAA